MTTMIRVDVASREFLASFPTACATDHDCAEGHLVLDYEDTLAGIAHLECHICGAAHERPL